jgi:hypothetical protein
MLFDIPLWILGTLKVIFDIDGRRRRIVLDPRVAQDVMHDVQLRVIAVPIIWYWICTTTIPLQSQNTGGFFESRKSQVLLGIHSLNAATRVQCHVDFMWKDGFKMLHLTLRYMLQQSLSSLQVAASKLSTESSLLRCFSIGACSIVRVESRSVWNEIPNQLPVVNSKQISRLRRSELVINCKFSTQTFFCALLSVGAASNIPHWQNCCTSYTPEQTTVGLLEVTVNRAI